MASSRVCGLCTNTDCLISGRKPEIKQLTRNARGRRIKRFEISSNLFRYSLTVEVCCSLASCPSGSSRSGERNRF
ncbi:hypothetical protein HanXRQr2_Chr14g0620381 [Helianthus annuus]|uniref:Uncharacterized protein n=1 Tax=Helianthus annuus TaxID=4232 RepID=A0A251SD89_HELAN|nr:hypothetical protein HanXRQr2_Chr14g0620381 [Helianthus annuus]